MNRRDYEKFCKKYELNPDDFDDVLFTVDELEGNYGDADGKLEAVREYIYNNEIDMYTPKEIDEADVIDVYVYQIEDTRNCSYAFMSYDIAKSNGGVDLNDYIKVATLKVRDGDNINDILESIFTFGNHHEEYYADNPRARSISVSDILEIKGEKYYVDSFGFVKLDEESKITEDIDDNVEDNKEEIDKDDMTTLDYLDELQGRQISVAELNVVLQSIFSRFNDIFIIESDLYNADLDETQELDIWDDDDLYVISYDVIDVLNGIIEITKVVME